MQITLTDEEVREILFYYMENEYGDRFTFDEDNCFFNVMANGNEVSDVESINFLLNIVEKS